MDGNLFTKNKNSDSYPDLIEHTDNHSLPTLLDLYATICWKIRRLQFGTLYFLLNQEDSGKKKRQNIAAMFPAGLEPATFRVLGGSDNHYTTETRLG